MMRKSCSNVAQAVLAMGIMAVMGAALAQAEDGRLVCFRFDEPSGPVCRDSSGHGRDAQLLAAKRVGDASGGALECDGQGRGAEAAGLDAVRLGEEFTVSVWVNITIEPKDMKGPWPSAVNRFAPGACGFRLGFIRDYNMAFFKWGNGTNPHGFGVLSRKDEWERGWHHLVGVFSKTPCIYVDGELSNSASLEGGFKDQGGSLLLGSDGFCGMLDEAGLYNKALSADEVRTLYLSGLAYAGGRNVRAVAVKPVSTPAQEAARAAGPRNRIPGDSGFESGIDHHWEAVSASVDRTTAAQGAACALLDATADTAGVETSDITVDVAQPHTFSAFVKGRGRAVLQITSVNPDDPYDGNWSKTQGFGLKDSWQRVSLTLEPGWNRKNQWSTVPRSGHKFRAAVRAEKGSKCWVDSLQFEEGAQAGEYAPSTPAAICISSGRPGNVFLSGEPVQLRLNVFAAEPGPATLRCAVKAYDGEVVCSRDEPLKLDPAGPVQQALDVPARKKGFFTVSAELLREGCFAKASQPSVALAKEGAAPVRTTFTFCIVPPPRETPPERSFFGMQGPVSEAWAEAMRRIGVKWFRMGLGWRWIEKKKGEFSWTTSDERVKLLRDRGIAIMYLLSGTADWARGEIPKDEWRVWAYPPKNMQDLTDFMEQAAAHYRGRVDCWEIWNESCLDYFKVNPASGKTKSAAYAEVLKAAYAGAKKGNPACTVCTNPITNKFVPFGDEVLTSAPDAFDVLNVHPYTGKVRFGLDRVTTPEAFKMREFMADAEKLTKEKARGQEVWNSEQGFTLDCDAAPDSDAAKDYARCMCRSLLLQRSVPIRRAFWFLTYDSRMCNNRKGMWRHGMQPLPIVAAYAALAQTLEGAGSVRPLAPPKPAPDGLCAYAFERDKGGVVALWLAAPCEDRPVLKFKPPGSIEVLDIMGNTPAGAALAEGECSVPISDSPVYVRSETMPWASLAEALERGRFVTEVPQIATRNVPAARNVKVDGVLDDWPTPPPVNDFAAMRDGTRLYLAVKAAETPCAQLWSANLLRLGNCLHLRLAAAGGAKKEFDEFLVGEGIGGAQVYCMHASGGREIGVMADAAVAVRRAKGVATYEISLPFTVLSPPLAIGRSLDVRFSAFREGQENAESRPTRLVLQP